MSISSANSFVYSKSSASFASPKPNTYFKSFLYFCICHCSFTGSSFRDSYVRRRRRTLSGSRSQLNSHRFRFPTPNHSRANSLCSGFHFRGNSLGCEERLNKSRTNNSCLHEANPHQQQQRPRHNSFHRNGCTFRNPVHKLPAASGLFFFVLLLLKC